MESQEEVERIRREILEMMPNAEEWMRTPHEMLGGKTPEECLRSLEGERVEQLYLSILYIGLT